jgi:hypothetical protein
MSSAMSTICNKIFHHGHLLGVNCQTKLRRKAGVELLIPESRYTRTVGTLARCATRLVPEITSRSSVHQKLLEHWSELQQIPRHRTGIHLVPQGYWPQTPSTEIISIFAGKGQSVVFRG